MNEDLSSLSERELEVLRLVATGATNMQIARDLAISPNTVKVHLRNIFEKLGVQSRTEATMEAVRRGWVESGRPDESQNDAVVSYPVAVLEMPEEPAIASWQRIYLVMVVILIGVGIWLPTWQQRAGATGPADSFTDLGRPRVAPSPRSQVARWTANAGLPVARSRLALVAGEGLLFALGGETAQGVTDQVTIYDPETDNWLSGQAMLLPVANIGGAWLDGRVYVPGGTTASGTVTDVVQAYDPDRDAWESVAPLPGPRAAYALAALSGKLYLFGGWDGERYAEETLTYDPRENAWSEGAPMATSRAFGAAAALGGVIYVVGGSDGQHEVGDVAVYDPSAAGGSRQPWSSRASLLSPRAGLGLAAIGSRLYAIGGGQGRDVSFNEQYDVTTGAWSRIETPVAGEWRNLGLAVNGERLHAVGGWAGSYLDSNEEYQALYRVLLPIQEIGSAR